eukprot:GHVS01091038.1.p1 GENE.GHVS01091038.1~~GHVS01091038.1.p1  ORF type:complete len:785 (+),score=88.96 GHVS01091038.1:178-2532(+)
MALAPCILVPQLMSQPHPDPDILSVVRHLPRMFSCSHFSSMDASAEGARKKRKAAGKHTTEDSASTDNAPNGYDNADGSEVLYGYECYPYNHTHPLFYNTQDKYTLLEDPYRVIPKPQHQQRPRSETNNSSDTVSSSTGTGGKRRLCFDVPAPLPPVLFSGLVKVSKFFRLFLDPSPPPMLLDPQSGYRMQLLNRDFNCWQIEGVFTGDEFRVLTHAVEDLMVKPKRSLVDSDDPGTSKARTSVSKPLDNSQFVHFLRRVSLLTGLPSTHFESLQIVGYTDKKMHYGMHHDSAFYRPNPMMAKHAEHGQTLRWMAPLLNIEAHHLAQREPIPLRHDENSKSASEGRLRTRTENVVAGEPFRILTMLVYINGLTKKEGGETTFPWAVLGPEEVHNRGKPVKFNRPQGARFRPAINSGVLWSNVTSNEEGQVVLDPRVIHSAERVNAGAMKFAVNVWGCNKVVQDTAFELVNHSDLSVLSSLATTSNTKSAATNGSKRDRKCKTNSGTGPKYDHPQNNNDNNPSTGQQAGACNSDSNFVDREKVLCLARVQRPRVEEDLFCETCGSGLEGFYLNPQEGGGSVAAGVCATKHAIVEKSDGYFVFETCAPVKEEGRTTSQLVMCEAKDNKKFCMAAAVCLSCYNKLWAKNGPYKTCADFNKSKDEWFCHNHRNIAPSTAPTTAPTTTPKSKITATSPKRKITATSPKRKITATSPKRKSTATSPKRKITATTATSGRKSKKQHRRHGSANEVTFEIVINLDQENGDIETAGCGKDSKPSVSTHASSDA